MGDCSDKQLAIRSRGKPLNKTDYDILDLIGYNIYEEELNVTDFFKNKNTDSNFRYKVHQVIVGYYNIKDKKVVLGHLRSLGCNSVCFGSVSSSIKFLKTRINER